MPMGIVKNFNNITGFGFIAPTNGAADVFVHKNGMMDTVVEGDTVSYTVREGQKGLEAVNVCKV